MDIFQAVARFVIMAKLKVENILSLTHTERYRNLVVPALSPILTSGGSTREHPGLTSLERVV